MTYHTVLH